MKFSKRMICLFLTVMLLGAVLALPAYAAESDCIQGIAFVNATSLRMRSAPSLSGKVLKSDRIPLAKAYEMVMNGEIKDGKTIAGVLKLKALVDEGRL